MLTALIHHDRVLAQIYAARQALERAITIPELKKIKDAAEAAEIYAKRQQLGEEAERFAYKIKILALAKLGGKIKEAQQAGELTTPKDSLRQGSRRSNREQRGIATLADLKID